MIKRPNTAKTLRAKYGDDYFSNMGKKGGAVSGIKKGLAALSPERLQEIRLKSLETRRRNAEKRNLEQSNIQEEPAEP